MKSQPQHQMLPEGDTYVHLVAQDKRCPCKPDWKLVEHSGGGMIWLAVHRNMDELKADRGTWS